MRLAAQLKGGDLQLLPERRVVKAAEVQAIGDARAMLEDARREAERIREAAKDTYETERQRGYQDGQAAAKAELAAQLAELTTQAARVVSEFEAQLPETVISAVRQILGTFDDTDLVLMVVRQALHMFHNQTELTLRVPPDRLEDIRARVAELYVGGGSLAHVGVVADRRLTGGACVLESELGSVDASIEAQLAVLERAMRKELAGRGGDCASGGESARRLSGWRSSSIRSARPPIWRRR